MKKREKQKREAMRNLHYLKDIACDTFESRKAEFQTDYFTCSGRIFKIRAHQNDKYHADEYGCYKLHFCIKTISFKKCYAFAFLVSTFYCF